MKHPNCGGVFIVIQRIPEKTVYQCNRCGKILTMYKRIATSGSPKEK